MPTTTRGTRQTIAMRVEAVRTRLATEDTYLENAVLAIYRMQTDQEQAWRTTINRNGCGFNSSDARRGSRFARMINASREGRRQIHPYYRDQARRWMRKYARQLIRLDFAQDIEHGTATNIDTPATNVDAINSADSRATLIDNVTWCDPNCERCAHYVTEARIVGRNATQFNNTMRRWRTHRTQTHTRAVNPPYVPTHVQRARRAANPNTVHGTGTRQARTTERTGKEIFDALGIPCEEAV